MAKIAMPRLKNSLLKTPSAVSKKDQTEQIQKLAYQLFVERGYEHGHDREDWLRAESIIKNKRS